MPYFLLRLRPPRPTFTTDITEDERDVILQHMAYWSNLTRTGGALIFGLVMDPKGVWALGIVDTPDEASVQNLIAKDPAKVEDLGLSYEVIPMPQAIARKAR